MAINPNDYLTIPEWGSHLPSRDMFPNADAYAAALQAYFDNHPELSANPDYTSGRSDMDIATQRYNKLTTPVSGNDAQNSSNALALWSRMHVRPEEAQQALEAFQIDPVTGDAAPMLNNTAINQMYRYGFSLPEYHSSTMDDRSSGGVDPDRRDRIGKGPGGDGTLDSQPSAKPDAPPGYHYEGDILVKDDDHTGQINVDGVWITPQDVIPQSPYPTLPDAVTIPDDHVGLKPLGFQVTNPGIRDQHIDPNAMRELAQNPDKYPQWVHDILMRRFR